MVDDNNRTDESIMGRPFFSKSVFGNIEIVAVIGIFTLYALQFSGIDTFSQLVPTTQTEISTLSFESGLGNQVAINFGTIGVMALVGFGLIIYFAFIRKQIQKSLKK